MLTTRVIVQRSVADTLISELKALVQKLKAGPEEDANVIGVRNTIFAERVIEFVKDAKDKGAEILVGDLKNDGSIIQPHLLLGYTRDMNAWKDEIFGPGECAMFLADTNNPLSCLSVPSSRNHNLRYR